MSNFPSNFRDLAGFSADGLEFSTTSNTAVKMYDALVHMGIYHYNSPQLGGFNGAVEEMFTADPDFAMGKVLTCGMGVFGVSPSKAEEPRKKLIDFSKSSQVSKITHLERMHLDAALKLTEEDMVGAMEIYESILQKYPRDTYALHMGYFMALTTGHTSKLRDIPASVVKHYKPRTPFYGHVHGKLCFGQGETGDYEGGELSGRLALDYQPLDNWASHALAHNFEESGRSRQGSSFLDNTEEQWKQGENFSLHIVWHQALLHLQLGEIQEATDLYDSTIGPRAIKDTGSFPLSDASALLMRLEMQGVDVKERARELVAHWETHNDEFVSLFYEGHACFNNLLAGDTRANAVLIDNMREYINDNRKGWNKNVVTEVGIDLMEGITAFFNADYDTSIKLLQGIMPKLQSSIQGSWAQKSIFRQILIEACIRSGSQAHLALARDILDQNMVERNLKAPTPANQRILDKILAMS